jgi:hypothetical protein
MRGLGLVALGPKAAHGSGLLTDGGAQLLYDLQCGFVSGFALVHLKGDGSDAGVAAASVTLADSG